MAVEVSERFEVRGEELTMEQAEAVKTAGMRLLDRHAGNGPVTADFAGLVQANSVTVAVMVAWFRHAQLQQKAIVFVNLPAALRDIIEFSGLSDVLAGADSGVTAGAQG